MRPVAAIAISSTVAPTVLRPLARPREISVPTNPPGWTLESKTGRMLEIESKAAAAKVKTMSPRILYPGVRKLRVLNNLQAAVNRSRGRR
jgi:hypothetical protein